METFAILGFVFGLVAFIRTEKLIRHLKKVTKYNGANCN